MNHTYEISLGVYSYIELLFSLFEVRELLTK